MTSTAARLRHHVARARRFARTLAPPSRTALRVPDGQRSPAPSGFASFGDGSWIVPPARTLNPGLMSIGDEVVVMEHSTLAVLDRAPAAAGPILVLGDRVRLSRFCTIVCEVGVTIGADVAGSDGVTIVDTWRQPIAGSEPMLAPPEPAAVSIGRGAYLGMGCCIGPGVTVGDGAYIGEGAVVLDDVPAHAVAVGNPATVIRRYDATSRTWEGTPWP